MTSTASNGRQSSSYTPRTPADTFTFSDEIEQELARMDAGGGSAAAAEAVPAAAAKPVASANSYVSSAALSASAAATRAAVANPAAYAEAHFGSRATVTP